MAAVQTAEAPMMEAVAGAWRGDVDLAPGLAALVAVAERGPAVERQPSWPACCLTEECSRTDRACLIRNVPELQAAASASGVAEGPSTSAFARSRRQSFRRRCTVRISVSG